MTAANANAVCRTHGTTNPCAGCAADHLVGAHATGAHRDTCSRCRTRRRRPIPAMPDVRQLAANDTDHLETDDA